MTEDDIRNYRAEAHYSELFADLRRHKQRAAKLATALKAAHGYMINAHIDLSTDAPKKTAMRTLEGGIALVKAALQMEDDDGV